MIGSVAWLRLNHADRSETFKSGTAITTAENNNKVPRAT